MKACGSSRRNWTAGTSTPSTPNLTSNVKEETPSPLSSSDIYKIDIVVIIRLVTLSIFSAADLRCGSCFLIVVIIILIIVIVIIIVLVIVVLIVVFVLIAVVLIVVVLVIVVLIVIF